MEMDLSLISILFSFIFLIIFSRYYLSSLLKYRKDGTQSPKTPPGRSGLPLIGETLSFVSSCSKGVPERFVLDRMKKYSSTVIKTSLFGEPIALMCGSEENKFVFSNENKLVRSWIPRPFAKLFDFPENIHIQETGMKNRKLFHPHLSLDGLQKYVAVIDIETKHHLQSYWEGRDVVTVLPLTKIHTLALLARLFLGIEDYKIVERLNKLVAELMEGMLTLPLNIPGTKFNRALQAKTKLKMELDAWIKKWRSDFSEGRLSASASQSMLADILKQSSPDEDNIFNSLVTLIAAAYDTTTSTLACLTMVLGKFPDVLDSVFAEQREIARSKGAGEMLNWKDIQKMKYSWNVVCEVLRMYPSTGIFREAISDITYGGVLIPKGWKLYNISYSTHRNPNYFKNPNKFDPSRFEGDGPISYSYIPFGGGPRMCPGKEYARIKILIFMHNLVNKFRWELVYPDEKVTLKPMSVPTKGLPVRLYPRK